MQKLFRYIKRVVQRHTHVFSSHFFLLIVIALLFRLFILYRGWSLGNDDSRDVMISLEALQRGVLPLIGPFSSAGPFVTGPLYYWLLMLGVLLVPFGLVSLWIFNVLINMVNIGVFMLIGYRLEGKKLAIIMGVLSAFSNEMVWRSLQLSNPTFVLFFTSLLILFFILFVQKKKVRYAFLVGVSLGCAINMHYQAVNLLFLPFLFFFVRGTLWKTRVYSFLTSLIGCLMTLIPLLIWDSQQQFANIRNILDFLLIGQYRIYVPNSWKIFLFHDMIPFWAYIEGGFSIFGFLAMVLIGLFILFQWKKLWKQQQATALLLLVFLLLLIINRFYHGNRFEGYLLYLSPFIIIFLAQSYSFFLYELRIKDVYRNLISKAMYLLLFLTLVGNLYALKDTYLRSTSNVPDFVQVIDHLQQKYPSQQFTLFDTGRETAQSLPLSLLMSQRKIEKENGLKIAIYCIESKNCPQSYEKLGEIQGFPIINLENVPPVKLRKFVLVNKTQVYESLIGWSNKHELKTTFDLSAYIRYRLHLGK